jgi:ribose transport system substrate-binding protein
VKKWLYALGIALCLANFSLAVYFAMKMYYTGSEKTSTNPKQYKYHFVLIPEELDNDYWRLVEKGAKQAAEENGVWLEYVGPKQANIDEHIKTIEMAAASKVDGIMTQGLSEELFTPLINSIVDKGIPVMTIDTDAAKSKRIAYIGTDNYYSGFLAGKALVADTKGKAKVGIITGRFDASHQQLRVQGFMDAIEHEKGIEVVAIEESNITRVQAAEKAYKILKEHPEVNAFYGTSALDGIGIAQVVQQFQKEDDVYIIAFDTLPETINYIKSGVIEATVVQEPYEMGYRAVKMMTELLEGKEISKVNHTETRVIRKADLPLAPREKFEVNAR